MGSDLSSTPADRLISRLDRAVWRTRFDLAMRLFCLGCGVAAVVVAMAAGLD